MTSFRYPSALSATAFLAAISSVALGAEKHEYLMLIGLIPLTVAIWAWRAGTDANEFGIRVRALFGRRVIAWSQIEALVPDQRGGAVAALTNGATVPLTAVRATDLPRLIAASGKKAAE